MAIIPSSVKTRELMLTGPHVPQF